jgi:nucleotidyltransferase/DNA polymerase involved in DNA repair
VTKKLSYVVGIKDASYVRRQLLEGARLTIGVIKEKKTLNNIRHKRKEKISDLKSILKDMHKSLSTLYGVLPEQSNVPENAKKLESKKLLSKTAAEKSQLSDVKGLGPARIQKLYSIGISSIRALAHASIEDLAKVDISATTAKKLIARAHYVDVPESEKAKLDKPDTKNIAEKSEMDLLEEKLSAIESKLKKL